MTAVALEPSVMGNEIVNKSLALAVRTVTSPPVALGRRLLLVPLATWIADAEPPPDLTIAGTVRTFVPAPLSVKLTALPLMVRLLAE